MLERETEPVSEFNDDLRALVEDMFETMYAAPGVGLAAPQVGLSLRLTVIDVTAGEEKGNQIVLVNPEIAHEEGSQKGEEGCLSIPGFSAIVERPFKVVCKAFDVEGNPIQVEGQDHLARVICHEVDHLEGVLYLDRISPIKRDMIKRKIRKLARAGKW